MLKKHKMIRMLGVFLLASCTSLFAQGGRMVHLGDAHVDGAVDHDTIRVERSDRAGGQTRSIDLPGDRRIIRSVDLWYGKATWRRRPKVSLYGVQ